MGDMGSNLKKSCILESYLFVSGSGFSQNSQPCVDAASCQFMMSNRAVCSNFGVWHELFVLFIQIQAQDIRVGNIVWLRENEEVPCDLVVIGTSDPQGICNVEV